MSEISPFEKRQERFEGFRRVDEPSGDWLQRVLYQPMQGFDVKNVQNKIDTMEEKRIRLETELKQDFHAACLEIEAWAASRPSAEHRAAFNGIESKIRAVHEEGEKQASFSYTERLRETLLRFTEMVGSAMSLLSSASQIFSTDTEVNMITAADSVSQLPSSSPLQPKVLVPDSDADVA